MKGIPSGTIWLKITLPVVVSIISPSIRSFILACIPTSLLFKAINTSSGDENIFPSPLSPFFSFVR